MKFTPRDYQADIIGAITDMPRVMVMAGMGTGKTVSTLTALDILSLVEPVYPVLILAPLRVAQSVWPGEVQKWDHLQHLRVQPILGDARQRLAALSSLAEIYAINYENIGWLTEHWGEKWPYRTVVCDESTKLKSLRTGGKQSVEFGQKISRKAKGKRAYALAEITPHTRRWINLTGTPAPNGLQDLWGQMWFIDRGTRLGRSYSAFERAFFVNTSRDPRGTQLRPLPHAEREIMERVSTVCLSVEAKDYMDLPELVSTTIEVELPPVVRKAYKTLEREMFMEFATGEVVEAKNAASKTIKCLQAASGALYTDELRREWAYLHDAKLDALEDIVEEAAGMPVLVAYHFKHDAERILKRFPKARMLDKKAETINEWNRGEIPMLIAHPVSCGHGLSLQDGGNILAFFSHWWSLEEYQQIIERIGPTRQFQAGHPRTVYVHHIVAKDTLDEVVMERRTTKATVQDAVMAYMKRAQ